MSEAAALNTAMGTLGAVVANVTGIGGGVVFYPYLMFTQGDAGAALTNSVCTQIVGMGVGSLCWLLRYGMDRGFAIELFRVVLFGYLGMMLGTTFLQLDQDTAFVVFTFSTIGLCAISLRYRFRPQTFERTRNAKYGAAEKPLFFASGVLTSQISIGFGECVMLIRYVLYGDFQQAVRLAVTSTAALLILFSLFNLPQAPDFGIVIFMATGTIPGAVIGFYLASRSRSETFKALVFKFLIALSVLEMGLHFAA